MTKHKENEFKYGQMEINMKESLLKTKHKEKELKYGQMEINMKESGLMAIVTEQDSKHYQGKQEKVNGVKANSSNGFENKIQSQFYF